MKIIKDKQIIEDTLTHVADNEEISSKNITVSLSRWKSEKAKLTEHQGTIGVRVSPADNIEDIADDLTLISLIAVELPAFTDGRAFSHTRLLRDRYNYQGEIRAIGSYMPDQVFYLTRVGVNAFEFDKADDLNVALSTMNDFSVNYQSSTN